MGVTKTAVYTDQQNEMGQLLKVLGHPARIAILEQLLDCQNCICNDFSRKIELAQPTISRHLKELKAIGIIQGNVEGTTVCYCINTARWEEIQLHISNFFGRLANGQS